MRLRPEVAELLFKEVPLGTKGKIIYRPVKVMKTSRGRVLLEVYRDFYRKGIDYREEVKKGLLELNAADEVDWSQIEEAIVKKDGIVRDISRKGHDA